MFTKFKDRFCCIYKSDDDLFSMSQIVYKQKEQKFNNSANERYKRKMIY